MMTVGEPQLYRVHSCCKQGDCCMFSLHCLPLSVSLFHTLLILTM
jgi:hypothetical protein